MHSSAPSFIIPLRVYKFRSMCEAVFRDSGSNPTHRAPVTLLSVVTESAVSVLKSQSHSKQLDLR